MSKKKVFCLYRVSTKKQVDRIQKNGDDDKFDIPLQKQACHEYIASRSDWEFYDELSELGISGFKVSAKDRDAIQSIQKAALESKFDILLVFMFDRLGRIDDETPFVLEWFVKHGIEVWSVKEGQQRFEQHVDKLTNYIRFWQAAGESEKTSIRTKERLSQIVQEGRFRGGLAPYGYKLVKKGRLNKKGHELYEIEIDEHEATVVRQIYDLYLTKGYGTQRISTLLAEQGVRTRKGSNFVNTTIRSIIKNNAYTGVLKSGDTVSEIFQNLQIISPEKYQAAMEMLKQRSADYQQYRNVPLNTKGSTLLSGNVFCGHCGARLVVTTNGKKYFRKDGEVTITPRTRYVCYYKTRHKHLCDGQTGYTSSKLDKIVDGIVHKLFTKLKDLPKEKIIQERYDEQLTEYQTALARAKAELQASTAEVLEYEAEVIKIIRGESKLNHELLNKLYEDAKEKVVQSEQLLERCMEKVRNCDQMKLSLVNQFNDIQNWSDMYDVCDMESKKMILAKIFRKIRVKRDYEVEIDLSISCEQLGVMLNESDFDDEGIVIIA